MRIIRIALIAMMLAAGGIPAEAATLKGVILANELGGPPMSGVRIRGRTPLPSRGGNGMRLKVKSTILSVKRMLSIVASPVKNRGISGIAAVTRVKSIESGA